MKAKENKLALTRSMLESAQKLTDVFELEPFKENFVKNYQMTTRKTDGHLVWEREKVLFMKKISADKKLEECSRLSIYSSFVELAVSGLTLYDDQCYIIAYKGIATFQIGWKGRFEQIARLDKMEEIGIPTIVYESDQFEYILGGMSPEIQHHKRTRHDHSEDEKSELFDPITHVYLTYRINGEIRCALMERHEVLAIRDNFSDSWKYYTKNGGKGKSQGGGTYDLALTMWHTHPEEAFKKTLIKRLYKQLPKSPRMVSLDSELESRIDAEENIQDIDYGIVEEVKSDSQVAQKDESASDDIESY